MIDHRDQMFMTWDKTRGGKGTILSTDTNLHKETGNTENIFVTTWPMEPNRYLTVSPSSFELGDVQYESKATPLTWSQHLTEIKFSSNGNLVQGWEELVVYSSYCSKLCRYFHE